MFVARSNGTRYSGIKIYKMCIWLGISATVVAKKPVEPDGTNRKDFLLSSCFIWKIHTKHDNHTIFVLAIVFLLFTVVNTILNNNNAMIGDWIFFAVIKYIWHLIHHINIFIVNWLELSLLCSSNTFLSKFNLNTQQQRYFYRCQHIDDGRAKILIWT